MLLVLSDQKDVFRTRSFRAASCKGAPASQCAHSAHAYDRPVRAQRARDRTTLHRVSVGESSGASKHIKRKYASVVRGEI